jgi:hypothetical protein
MMGRLLGALSLVLVALCVSSAGGLAAVRDQAPQNGCLKVAKGAPWKAKSQKGTLYQVIGLNGGSCPLGVKWVLRLSRQIGVGLKGPTGWRCVSATAFNGECMSKTGAVFEWRPRLKK